MVAPQILRNVSGGIYSEPDVPAHHIFKWAGTFFRTVPRRTKRSPCRLAYMADKDVRFEIYLNRNVSQDSSRHHGGAESVYIERQQLSAGTAGVAWEATFWGGGGGIMGASTDEEELSMKKGLTELVFILDCSGSMAGLESDTIGGFNAMIEKQRRAEGEAYVSTVLFNTGTRVIHDRVGLSGIEPMTDAQYTVGGGTALLDAVGGAIRHISNVHRYARPEDVPEHTLFVITTDGMENASHRYTAEEVRGLIERRKSRHGWEFIFLGANIDAVATARGFGIGSDRAVSYRSDPTGTRLNYEVVGDAVSCLRTKASLPNNWMERIQEDMRTRR